MKYFTTNHICHHVFIGITYECDYTSQDVQNKVVRIAMLRKQQIILATMCRSLEPPLDFDPCTQYRNFLARKKKKKKTIL